MATKLTQEITPQFKIVNLSELARQAGIHKSRLFSNLNGWTDTLTDNERTTLINILHTETGKLFHELGFDIGKPKRIIRTKAQSAQS